MKFNLKWYTAAEYYYAPLCEGPGYIPTFHIKKMEMNLNFTM